MLRAMNLRTLYQKSFLLPLCIGFTYLCLLAEAVKYPGFVENHFFIDPKYLFAIVVAMILFFETQSKISRFVFKLNWIFLVIISTFYLLFSLLEGSHYTNFVLATYHFHLDGLILSVLFSLFIFLSDKFKSEIPKVNGKFNILYIILAFLIIFFLVKNVAYAADTGINRNSYILFHLGSSYDDRMTYQWGIFYQFMVFVKNNTPPDATIVIPPEQDPWLMGSGNNDFVRAFIYPRKIVQETLIIPDLSSFGSNTFILITWGKEACKRDGCHGWPRQEIKTSKIIYKDPQSEKAIETKENTIYNPEDTKYVYGLIKL
jgi:hypothetical protein